MTQDQSTLPDEITCENVTGEVVALYAQQGYILDFAEEVMRFDLSLVIPQVSTPGAISFLTWADERIHEFFSVYQAAFHERPGFPGWSEEVWVEWTAGDPSFRPDLTYLAIIDGNVAGFITSAEEGVDVGWVIQVGTHPQWRGKGIGTALIIRALRAWKAKGKEAVMLHVNVNNPGAIRLYLQLGFVIVGRRGKLRMNPHGLGVDTAIFRGEHFGDAMHDLVRDG